MSRVTRRPRSLRSSLAWAIVALYVVLVVIALRLHATMMGIGVADVWVYFTLLWGAIIGALIIGRFPAHPVGWLFIAVALSFGLALLSSGYAIEAIDFDPDSLPGGDLASWLSFWIAMPGIAGIVLFLPLLFPDGHLPSRRWRPVAWFAGAIVVAAIAVAMVTPDSYSEYPNIRNPLGIVAWKGAFDVLNSASEVALLVLVMITAVALLDRRRRASPEQRL